jgi:hypothetical protein
MIKLDGFGKKESGLFEDIVPPVEQQSSQTRNESSVHQREAFLFSLFLSAFPIFFPLSYFIFLCVSFPVLFSFFYL